MFIPSRVLEPFKMMGALDLGREVQQSNKGYD